MNPIKIVHSLRMASGANAKKKILRQHQDNDEWKQVLLAMYDTSINYYISAPKDVTYIDDPIDIQSLLGCLLRLESREYTGTAARNYVLECSRRFGEIFRLILDGSLKAGVSIKTINAEYPGLIPEHEVMKGRSKIKPDYPCLASIKYDGVRTLVFIEETEIRITTSHGKEMFIDSLVADMKDYPLGVYDGELVSGDGKMVSRVNISGQVTKNIKGNSTDMVDYRFAIFDYVTLSEWDSKKCETPYVDRYRFLFNIIEDGRIAVLAEQHKLGNHEQAEKQFKYLLKHGWEGLILRGFNDPYIWGRSDKIVKMKGCFTATVTCTGTTISEDTKYEGMIGALKYEDTVKGIHVKGKTGSGLTDFDRELSPENFIGKQIEIEYNDITKDKKTGQHSLFLAVFKRIKGER